MSELTRASLDAFEKAIVEAEQQPHELSDDHFKPEEAWKLSEIPPITDDEGFHEWRCFRQHGKVFWVDYYWDFPEREQPSPHYELADPRQTVSSKRNVIAFWERQKKTG